MDVVVNVVVFVLLVFVLWIYLYYDDVVVIGFGFVGNVELCVSVFVVLVFD